jgi:Lar family restriction alleviation protein
MENEYSLKPCPFCGGSAKLASGPWTMKYVVCEVCDAEGPYLKGKDEAIEAWNSRVPIEEN